jgi:outer membrane biosynthesis protein TonB
LSGANDWRYAPVNRQETVAIPRLWIALFLSLHFHAAMLWFWLPRLPQPPHLSVDEAERGQAHTVLVTRLAPLSKPEAPTPPPPSPPPSPPTASIAPPQRAAAPAARPTPPALAAIKPPPPPPVAVPTARPAEPMPRPAVPPVAEPTPVRPPAETDLSAYIAARRNARADPPESVAQGTTPNAPPETDIQRRDRIVAGNLASNQQPTFGYDPKSGGGIFQLKRIGYEDAEFWFTGWNKDIGRRAKQLIEVRRGNNNDIRRSIVTKIISIIRDEVQGDFTWLSERTGRQVTLSARPGDTAELEEFLMQEFFTDTRRPR